MEVAVLALLRQWSMHMFQLLNLMLYPDMKKLLYFSIILCLSLVLLYPLISGAQGNLQFSRVLLVDAGLQTVPANAVWKIESVMTTNNMVPPAGTTDNTYYTISKIIEVNGNQVIISRACRYTENNSRYNSESTTDIGVENVTELPLWLPVGTTLKTGTNASFISVIEFNIVP
jgi:hypothetical protein